LVSSNRSSTERPARLIVPGGEAVAARIFSVIFRLFAFWLLKIWGTTVNIRNTCSGPPFRSKVTFARRTDWRRVRGPFPLTFAFPMRAQNPMQTATLPDISVDFMTWLNTELRKRIDADDDSQTSGLVNRLRNYFGRPVDNESADS
jgi:hypothetical protein